MQWEKIEAIAKTKGYSMEKLAGEISFTGTGLRRAIKKQTLTVVSLQKIAKVLKVPIVSFFTDNPSKNLVQEPNPEYGFDIKKKWQVLIDTQKLILELLEDTAPK